MRQRHEWRMVELLFVGATVEAVVAALMGAVADAAGCSICSGGRWRRQGGTGSRVGGRVGEVDWQWRQR